MINWFKSLFTKRAEVVNKQRELTSNELWLLNKLKYDEVYTTEKGNKCYLLDGTYIEILGRYSYPDVDMTKSGWVCKNINTGVITDLGNWVSFYNRKPHEWVKELSPDQQSHYRLDSYDLSDTELSKKYFDKIPKEYLREQRLKQLGI
jgi:transposase InsO family protein